MENNIFYCYSNNLHNFLKSMRFNYISSDINRNTNKRYWTYRKSDNLDKAIELYNSVKFNFN